jgi:hypothetical protein
MERGRVPFMMHRYGNTAERADHPVTYKVVSIHITVLKTKTGGSMVSTRGKSQPPENQASFAKSLAKVSLSLSLLTSEVML